MKKLCSTFKLLYSGLLLMHLISCQDVPTVPDAGAITTMNLKRGPVISCGPLDQQLGEVDFKISCSQVKNDFNLAIKFLHSFEYDEAEKSFARIIDQQPGCAMAYWGVAMSNFHPLWTPPTEMELKKGARAIEIAQSITQKSDREGAYINAIATFYKDYNRVNHLTRCSNFEKAMDQLCLKYPNDQEASIFHALALTASADPTDHTYAKQKKAGALLNALYPDEPLHPGIIHYLIHTYDYPELAALALPAARKYALVAPSSAHALHMPSHIFTRLGLWDECITSNIASVASAKCYAQSAGIKGHWDEELHGLDYLVYAYLQKGENNLAQQECDYLDSIQEVNPVNFKVAYAFAAVPSRYLLENKNWQGAARLESKKSFPWDQFPWQQAMITFTRLLGAVHIGKMEEAKKEFSDLNHLHTKLIQLKDDYKANQVLIQIKAAEAWMRFAEGKNEEALQLMNLAADMEDQTEKHPVTPGELIPARELLGDMLLQMKQSDKGLQAYEANLKKHPNRFNGLYGAGWAAEQSGNREKASLYYRQLLSICDHGSTRLELKSVKQYLRQQKS